MGTSQPRVEGGRFGEKIEVGVQRRLTEALRRALGHDGTDNPPDPDAELTARLDAQLDVADDLDVAVADAAPSDASDLVLAGKSASAPAVVASAPVITFSGPAGTAFSDTAGLLWTQLADNDYPTLLGREDDVEVYERFLTFLDRHKLTDGDAPAGPDQAPEADVPDDIDARLDAQEKALIEVREERPVSTCKGCGDTVEFDDTDGWQRLDGSIGHDLGQEGNTHSDVMEPPEGKSYGEKLRKFDADKHPRDWRGRFATIGSTVSLPAAAGGGEGRVVAATGSNHVRVRKADGTEVDVDAKDTEVTASAAANAAAGFDRAGQGEGFSRAGQDATVGTPAAKPPGVSKPRATAPDGKPDPTPAKPPAGSAPKPDAPPARTPVASRAQGHPDTGTRQGTDGHVMVRVSRLEAEDHVLGRDGQSRRVTAVEKAPNGRRKLTYHDGTSEHYSDTVALAARDSAPDGADAAKPKLKWDGTDGQHDRFAQYEAELPGGGRVRVQQGRDGKWDVAVEDKPGTGDPNLPDTRWEVIDAENRDDALAKAEKVAADMAANPELGQRDNSKQERERAAAARTKHDTPAAPDGAAAPLDALMDANPGLAGRTAAVVQGGKRVKLTDDEADLIRKHVDPSVARVFMDGKTPWLEPGEPGMQHAPGSAAPDATALAATARDAAAAIFDEVDNGTRPGEHVAAAEAISNAASALEKNDPAAAAAALSGLDHAGVDPKLREQLTAGLGALTPAPGSAGGDVPEGGEWGQAPESIDDSVDRSTWTGDQPPGGFDGTGTRPDGSAWGSGYPEGDPRLDPAYDQYTADMDEKLRAGIAKYGETDTLLDKVDGAPNAYQPDRHAAHDAIIDELMADYAEIPRENRAVIMAGPPGAGKTTVIVTNGSDFGVEWDPVRKRPANFAVVNPDDMKEELVKRGLIPTEYDEFGLAPAEMASFIHEESSWLAERLLTRLKADGVNLILDGTFAGKPDKQVGKVHGLRSDGYSVRGVLVDGTVPRSLSNAGMRHRKAPVDPGGRYGGRYVPMGHIKSNEPSGDQQSQVFGRPHRNKSSENIERAQDAFDDGVAWYDNSTGESTKIHDTFPDEKTGNERRLAAIQRRIELVSDDAEKARLQQSYDELAAKTNGTKSLDALGWFEAGGADLEDAVLDVLAKQLDVKAAGGADRNRGKAEQLRRYWVRGEGAAKIGWGTDGDFLRCVALVSEHMEPERAKGYCNLRHQDAVGKPPGQGHKWLGKVQRKEQPTEVPTQQNPAGENTLPNENPKPDGVMVALYPADDIVSALALDGGLPANDLHVTLAYLGKVDEIGDPGQLIDAIAQVAARNRDLEAMVAGLGRWDAGEDGDAFVALVDSPDLAPLRAQVLEACEAAGKPAPDDHGFTAHITLAYLTADDPTPVERIDSLPATFQFLSLAIGEDVYDFPLALDDAGYPDAAAASTQGEGDAPYDAAAGTKPPAV